MTTLTGRTTRTITGYVTTLLEYPRWIIEREVDFTNCHHSGRFDPQDEACTACRFGKACCWLNLNRAEPTPNSPLPELLSALVAAVAYLHSSDRETAQHSNDCECDTCLWLREAMSFLRQHRHKA